MVEVQTERPDKGNQDKGKSRDGATKSLHLTTEEYDEYPMVRALVRALKDTWASHFAFHHQEL